MRSLGVQQTYQEEVNKMAIGTREVGFIIDVDSGKLVRVEKGSGVTQTGPDPTIELIPGKDPREEQQEQEIKHEVDDIKRGKRHLPVADIIQINESPGCVYWNGKRWVKYC
jgi:hypothetical protein